VLVEVRASGVNPIDGFVRSGAYPMLGEPPFILGWDISGVVAAVNPGVYRFQVGDEVYGMPWLPRQGGGYAEYVSVPSLQLGHKPKTIDHVHAAALPLVGLTAWQALVEIADVQPGERVLIHAAAAGSATSRSRSPSTWARRSSPRPARASMTSYGTSAPTR